MADHPSRREVLQGAAAAMALATGAGGAACGSSARTSDEGDSNIYAKLGVRPVINGVGTVTNLGGSIMPPEVVQAMVDASKHFVPFRELQEKAGRYLADLIGVPAALISDGAASAITVGTAACVTRGDREKQRKLPDTTGMRNEIISQRAHRCGYEAQMWLVGTKTVWVETREEAEKAINDRTAMMFFLNKADPDGQIKRAEWIEIAKKHDVPTLNDAAADVPPAERLRSYVEEGFDLVVFSGGKGLLGPQGSGLLLGRPDLIAAGQDNISPSGGIGRGMKVGKEEIMGLVAAVERYLKVDHAAERREMDGRAEHVIGVLKDVEGVETEIHVPEIANHVPHVLVKWNAEQRGLSPRDVVQKLREGEPPVAVSGSNEGLRISMWMLRPGEERIVADRVREVLTPA